MPKAHTTVGAKIAKHKAKRAAAGPGPVNTARRRAAELRGPRVLWVGEDTQRLALQIAREAVDRMSDWFRQAPTGTTELMPKTQQLLDTTPIRRATPAMTRARERAVRMVLDGTVWSTAREVGERADPNAKNKHALASRLLKERRVFALERAGVNEFPDYEFDVQGNPVPAMRDVLKIFAGYSAFRIASWFESTSSALGGRRPREMLADHPEEVVAAARRHTEGPQHG
jgi:hypothetical protein